MSHTVFAPITLPNGTTLSNRLAKAAMEENMAVVGHLPGEDIFQLYKTWSAGGTGLLITGNVMVDHRAMTGPGGIALEANTPLAPFKNGLKQVLNRVARYGCKLIILVVKSMRQWEDRYFHRQILR